MPNQTLEGRVSDLEQRRLNDLVLFEDLQRDVVKLTIKLAILEKHIKNIAKLERTIQRLKGEISHE